MIVTCDASGASVNAVHDAGRVSAAARAGTPKLTPSTMVTAIAMRAKARIHRFSVRPFASSMCAFLLQRNEHKDLTDSFGAIFKRLSEDRSRPMDRNSVNDDGRRPHRVAGI